MSIRFDKACLADAQVLAALSERTFRDAFSHLFAASDLNAYLGKECSESFFRNRLERDKNLLLVRENDIPIGYGMLGKLAIPTDDPPAGSMQVTRLYIDKAHQGKGLGSQLLERMFAVPSMAKAPAIYLNVWEGNTGAIALYERYGFVKLHHCPFYVGKHVHTDWVMRRDKQA